MRNRMQCTYSLNSLFYISHTFYIMVLIYCICVSNQLLQSPAHLTDTEISLLFTKYWHAAKCSRYKLKSLNQIHVSFQKTLLCMKTVFENMTTHFHWNFIFNQNKIYLVCFFFNLVRLTVPNSFSSFGMTDKQTDRLTDWLTDLFYVNSLFLPYW